MNKFDEAIKVLYCDIYEINDFGDTNMFLSPDDALMIKKTLELGKLYKEYSDLQFEIIVSFSNHHNFVRGEEIQRELNEIAKKINELLYE